MSSFNKLDTEELKKEIKIIRELIDLFMKVYEKNATSIVCTQLVGLLNDRTDKIEFILFKRGE